MATNEQKMQGPEMFYRPNQDDHGLPHDPFKAIVSPRPIAWISSCDLDGNVNLAPYSFFNGISDDPAMIMYSTTGQKIGLDEEKDSLANIRATGEFCVSIVSSALKDAMNISSGHFPHGQDEYEKAGLEKGTPQIVSTPFVKASPASFECKLYQEISLPGDATLILGTVEGVHLDETHFKDGIFDVSSYQPLARLGYRDYATISDIFSLNRPGQS